MSKKMGKNFVFPLDTEPLRAYDTLFVQSIERGLFLPAGLALGQSWFLGNMGDDVDDLRKPEKILWTKNPRKISTVSPGPSPVSWEQPRSRVSGVSQEERGEKRGQKVTVSRK